MHNADYVIAKARSLFESIYKSLTGRTADKERISLQALMDVVSDQLAMKHQKRDTLYGM
jgi:hypothetical protein